MDINTLLDPNNVTIIFICVGLCVVGLILLFILQFVGGIFAGIMSLFEVVFQVISGGPVAWCGCLVGLLVCCGVFGVIVAFASIFQDCGTPNAVNFCRLLGY